MAGYNHNLGYLASTKLIPNFDTTKVIPGNQITGAYSAWSGLPTTNLYDAADYTLNMSAVGSRHYPSLN